MSQGPVWPRALLQDRRGAILPMATVGLLLAAGLIGSAIDVSRGWKVRHRLQSACDAGVLAGRRAMTDKGYDAAAADMAQRFFAANFAGEAAPGTFAAVSSADGNTLSGEASVALPTLIMHFFGQYRLDFHVTCASTLGVGNADVTMVLDTTGSMAFALDDGRTRIEALREAMNAFHATLAKATAGSNARVRYGFVPFSSSVNVGRLLYDTDPGWLVDRRTYQSRAAVYRTVVTVTGYQAQPASSTSTVSYTGISSGTPTAYGATAYTSAGACAAAIPASDADYQSVGTATSVTTTSTNGAMQKLVTTVVTQPEAKATYGCYASGWKYQPYVVLARRDRVTTTTLAYDAITSSSEVFHHWDYRPVTFDTSDYKRFVPVATLTGEAHGQPVMASSTWAGCIEERATVRAAAFTYSSIDGLSPGGAHDIDLDAAPTADEATKWAPMWQSVAYRRWTGSGYYTTATTRYGGPAWSADPAQNLSFCPQGARLLAPMSAADFAAYAASLHPEGATYLDIGMIWGGRLASPDGLFADTVNARPANGGEVSRHVIFMTDGEMEPHPLVQQAWGMEYWDRRVTDDGTSDDAARHDARFLATCAAVREKGIRVWVVAFTSALTDDLKACASAHSAFVAKDAGELNAAFQEIARQVGELRIVS